MMNLFHHHQTKTDILGFKEVSGIGQLIYHPFRFKKYEFNIDKDSNYCIAPFYRPGYELNFPKDVFLSGQGLLTLLCNLAMQLNSFDAKMVKKEGTFEINTFLDGLGNLYNIVVFYVALKDVCIVNAETAYYFSKE